MELDANMGSSPAPGAKARFLIRPIPMAQAIGPEAACCEPESCFTQPLSFSMACRQNLAHQLSQVKRRQLMLACHNQLADLMKTRRVFL